MVGQASILNVTTYYSFICIFQHLNSELMKKLAAFDPLGKDTKVDIHKANDRLKGRPLDFGIWNTKIEALPAPPYLI